MPGRARILLCLLILAVPAACDRTDPAEDPAMRPPPGDQVVAIPPVEERWATQVGGSGVSLTLLDAGGTPIFRLACLRGPARMTIEVEEFRAIGSEERLSFGVDGEPFVFVADPTADRPSGVQAEGPIEEGLLARLEQPREIAAVYGAQQFGPRPPPEPGMVRDLVSACRQIAAS